MRDIISGCLKGRFEPFLQDTPSISPSPLVSGSESLASGSVGSLSSIRCNNTSLEISDVGIMSLQQMTAAKEY